MTIFLQVGDKETFEDVRKGDGQLEDLKMMHDA
jgi:hypothetical protein